MQSESLGNNPSPSALQRLQRVLPRCCLRGDAPCLLLSCVDGRVSSSGSLLTWLPEATYWRRCSSTTPIDWPDPAAQGPSSATGFTAAQTAGMFNDKRYFEVNREERQF